jgi:hypothetical protein
MTAFPERCPTNFPGIIPEPLPVFLPNVFTDSYTSLPGKLTGILLVELSGTRH